jgi:hypothetical protein
MTILGFFHTLGKSQWNYIALSFLAAITVNLFRLGTARAENYADGPHYFSWAVLKVDPVKMTNPISATTAKQWEEKEEPAYYVAYFNKDGKLSFVEKRLEQKMFFRISYSYENGKLVERVVTKDDGRIVRFKY